MCAGTEMKLRRFLLTVCLLLLTACDSGQEASEPLVRELGTAGECDAALQPCQLGNAQFALTLELERNIRTLKPFRLQLHLAGSQPPLIEEVMVEFFMEGMAMGVNRYRLLRDDSGWHGEITLPICVAGRSDWRAVVEVRGAGNVYRAVFPFHSSG